MNDSERWADAIREAYGPDSYWARSQEDNRNRGSGGGGGGGGGGGIGNLAGWVCLAGMIGALLGGVVGRGFVGAVVGGLFLAGLVWVPGALLRPGAGTVSRLSVIGWAVGGAVVGLLFGVGFALVWDIVFLQDVVESSAPGFCLLGFLGLGGIRLKQRG